MFPVINGVYYLADLSTPATTVEDEQRRNLMIKEYFFCKSIKNRLKLKQRKFMKSR